MKLTPSEYTELLRLAQQHHASKPQKAGSSEFAHQYSTEAGESLHANTDDTRLIIVSAGTGRFIDQDKTFEQYTIECLNAPFAIGTLQLLRSGDSTSEALNETCVAASVCEITDLGSIPLAEPVDIYLRTLLADRICSNEYPRLARLAAADSADSGSTLPGIERTVAEWGIVKPDTVNDHVLFVYADRPAHGHVYGDLIENSFLTSLGPDALFPRVLGLRPSPGLEGRTRQVSRKTRQQPHNIQPGSSLASQTIIDQVHSADQPEGVVPEPLKHGFRWYRPNNRQGSYAGLLLAVTEHFEIPIRRETVRRAGELLDRLSSPGLESRLLRTVDQLGLDAYAVSLHSAREIRRLPTPCIWWSETNRPLLLVAVSTNKVQLIDPSSGPRTLSVEQFEKLVRNQQRVVVLTVGRHTPRNTFGAGWILPYLSRFRFELFEVFVASFLTQIFALANPLLFQQIIDRVIGQSSEGALMGLTILMVLFMVLEIILGGLRTFQFAEISKRVDISLGSAVMSRLLRLNMRFIQSHPVGELSGSLGELDSIRRFLTGTALTILLDAIFSLAYFVVMFVYSPTLAGIMLGSVPLLVAAIFGLAPVTENLLREKGEAQVRAQSLTVELLNGVETIKVQNSELTAKQRWEERQLDTIDKGFRSIVAGTAGSSGIQLINKVTGILIISVGASQVLGNEMTLGELIAFRIISGYVTQPLIRLAASWQSFQEASLSFERIAGIVNQPLETIDDEINNIPMPPLKGKITLDQVSFAYGSGQIPQISGISIDILPGSFVGLVGQSGCGKSTLLKLITRLYTPTAGVVLIDGLDIQKVELYSLRRQIGYVPQDCLLFEGSIFSNIAVADPDADSQSVIHAARLACAHEFIMAMPHGYSSTIGEKGSGLSGGQRQRIALARMFLQQPSLIIIDEATSALDVDTERQVLNNLLESARSSTVLMTTHRLATLVNADTIVMLHNGTVDSSGSHNQLMDKKGRYFALYQQQYGA